MDNEQFNETTSEKTFETTDEINVEAPIFTQTKEKKYITLDETITLQAIICVVISIVFIVANMFAPEIAEQLSSEFRENYYISDERTNEVIKTFLDFINSKPVSYD